MPDPAVSAIMAVHDGLPYIEMAVRSILQQSLRDIEMIVVDDASTDGTPGLLARLAAEDPRLRVIALEENEGPARARNRALLAARGAYVAVMDADDIAHPQRFAVQKAWLDAHPQVLLLGTSNRIINSSGQVQRTSRRAHDAPAVRWLCRFNMPLMHPSVMFRRLDPQGQPWLYDRDIPVGQDYDLISRVLMGGDVVSLPDVLLDYRVHPDSITGTKWTRQQAQARVIALRVQEAELPPAVVAALAPFRTAYYGLEPVPPAQIFAALRAMLAHDRATDPPRAAWARRQAAQLARAALLRSRQGGRWQQMRAFLGPGRDFLLPLILAMAEARGLMPRA